MTTPESEPAERKPVVVPTFRSEAKFSVWVRKQLKERYPELLVINVTGTGYGVAGVHDLILCQRGVFLSVELKMPGKKLTPLQDTFALNVQKAKGTPLAPCYPTVEHIEGLFFFLDEIERGWERRKIIQSLTKDEVEDVVRRVKEEVAEGKADEEV